MSQTLLQTDITDVLGLEALSAEEKVVFLSNIGDVIMESALLRLVADLSTDQQAALEQFLESEPDPETLMKHLLEHHKEFEHILEEEVIAFKEEALAVLDNSPYKSS